MTWSKAARDAAIAARRSKAKGRSSREANVQQAAIQFRNSARGGSMGLNAYRRATGRPGLGDKPKPPAVHPPAQRVAGQTKLRAAKNALQAGISETKAKKGTRTNRYAPQNRGGIKRGTLRK